MLNSEVFTDKILEFAKKNKKKYYNNKPFPHIVIDDAIELNLIQEIIETYPTLSNLRDVIHHKGSTDDKLASKRGDKYQTNSIKALLRFLNSSLFVDFLQILTSIKEPLIPDPHFIGGGMHQIRKGGFLKIHADFCYHPETKLDRRINVLIYLNKSWEKSFGGELNLYSKDMKNCVQKITPLANRMVIFNTTSHAYHGHPDPLNCPENKTRNSLALYYYSNGRPKEEIRSFLENQSTIYKKWPGEKFIGKSSFSSPKKFIIYLIPPIFLPVIRKLKNLSKKS